MEIAFFSLVSLITIFSALMVIVKRNPIISGMFLILTFFCLAILYVMLGAQFIASMQVIVYSGAIMVLFVFVVMMLNLDASQKWEIIGPIRLWLGFGAAAGIFLVLAAALKISVGSKADLNPAMGTVSNFGEVLFRDFLLPFEIVSVLLFAAIIGIVMLIKGKPAETMESATGEES